MNDPAKRRVNDARWTLALSSAWEELFGELKLRGVSIVELKQEYTLPAATDSLDPATAGISNFGQPLRVWAKSPGSPDTSYRPLNYTSSISPDAGTSDPLTVYAWTGNTLKFVPSSTANDLLIEYIGSGRAPDSGTLGIDDCLNVISKLMVAVVGPALGLNGLADRCRHEVYGDRDPDSPKHMHVLVQSLLKVQQRDPVQMPAYSVGASARAHWKRSFPRLVV